MDSAMSQLLAHYLGAARALEAAPTGGSDASYQAAAQLLRRQAVAVQRLHERQTDKAHVALLQQRLDDVVGIATRRLYAYRFDQVPQGWRALYTDGLVLATHVAVVQWQQGDRADDDMLDAVVDKLDRALITTGAVSSAGRIGAGWVDTTLRLVQAAVGPRPGPRPAPGSECFSAAEPFACPRLAAHAQCRRLAGWSMARFHQHMRHDASPLVFTDLMAHWPALTHRPWRRRAYLLAQTLGGRRLVPVEVGRSYVDDGWGQQLIPFARFLHDYIDAAPLQTPGGSTGYLAQHNLFHQVPALRNDIAIPDYCWAACSDPCDGCCSPCAACSASPCLCSPPAAPCPCHDAAQPLLNAWFGPPRTITPLHTDAHDNLLCQVVGRKYVRLYPPTATHAMSPRGREQGVDMANTSSLDLGLVEGWDDDPVAQAHGSQHAMLQARQRLRSVHHVECILGPGDALLIPKGWWHYVRSLSISFTVSFWWKG